MSSSPSSAHTIEATSRLIDRILAAQPDFETYTDGRAIAGVVPFTAPSQARPVAIRFLEFRHTMHEHVDLLDYEILRRVRWGWGFGFDIRKTADDITSPVEQTGKGAITNDCKILVWNAGP